MPKATVISEITEKVIIEFYLQNTARLTAKHFHIRPSRLNRILEQNKIKRHDTIKTKLSSKQIKTIINDYSIKTDLDICREFHITKPVLYKLLSESRIERHTEELNRSLAQRTTISTEQEKEMVNFYATNNIIATSRKFNTGVKQIKEILAKYNISLHSEQEINDLKRNKQSNSLKKYYQTNPDVKYKSYGRTRYIFKGLKFDSSWELCFWIWATDLNKNIQRSPCCFEYYSNDKKHFYFPDFLFENKLIEIKGDHMIKNGKLFTPWNNLKVSENQ